MADAISLTLSNGDSPSIVVSASNSVSTLVATPDSSVSLDVSPASNASVSINTVPTTQLSVSTLGSTVSTVSQLNNSLTVATALQTPLKLSLRDLEDVSGDPTSQQVLVYDAGDNAFVFADQSGSGGDGSGSQNTDAAIEVTNTDGAFDTIFNTTYESNSSVTTILSQILNPYVVSTLNLTNIKIRNELNSTDFAVTSSHDVEVGVEVEVKGIKFSTTKPSQIQDESIALLIDGQTQANGWEDFPEEGFDGYFVDQDMQIKTLRYNTPQTDTFKLVATDLGSAAIGVTYPISSSGVSVSWKYKAFLCTSATSLVEGDADGFNSIINGTASDSVDDTTFTSSSPFVLYTDASSDVAGNFTYIAYPKVLGVVESIKWVDFPIGGDFTLVGEFSYTNAGAAGLVQPYYIYKSNQSQGLGSGWKLTITTN